MRYEKLSEYEKAVHPCIHYTGSVRGMKNLGYWRKNDECVRCGQYIYNLSIFIQQPCATTNTGICKQVHWRG